VVLDQLKLVGTQLSWLGSPYRRRGSGSFETVDLAACLAGHSVLQVPACDVEHRRYEQFLALYSKFSEGYLGCMPQQPGCLVIQRFGAFLEVSYLENHRELTALLA
jgi:hypothetical protein